MPTPTYLSDTSKTNVRVMKREIDVLMDRIICKVEVGRNKMKTHERSKRHQDIMNNTKGTKQEPEPKSIEKEKTSKKTANDRLY